VVHGSGAAADGPPPPLTAQSAPRFPRSNNAPRGFNRHLPRDRAPEREVSVAINDIIDVVEQNDLTMPATRAFHGKSGGRTSARGSGERFAKTTATTATRGIISLTISRARGRTGGAKTDWAGSATQTAVVLRARALERAGPDPEGTPVRADQQRSQSRRGREGILLLPRQHAYALVHEVPVQVPQREFPYVD